MKTGFRHIDQLQKDLNRIGLEITASHSKTGSELLLTFGYAHTSPRTTTINKMKTENAVFHSAIYFSAALLLVSCNGAKQQDHKRPNILFIVADDLGWSDLGCYGADLHETPNLDKLANKSARFLNSYAAAPICSPTRASLMTGKYPARLHFTIWSEAASPSGRKNQEVYRFLPPQTLESLPLEEVTIAEELKKSGYLTAHIGKWHLGDLMLFPQNQGFDVSIAASQRGAPPTYFYPYKGFEFGEFRFITDLGTNAEGKYFADRKGEYLTDRLTDEALKIIGDAGDRPFYLNLWFYNVHTPLEAKASDIALFKNRLSPAFHHQNETYAAMVKSVDDNVGRLLKKLDDLGIAENTVVI
ncbi:MAG TPA: sulfatase-like hydrolase/transferase, partial [Prolixibacteraceae bacterium]|nr:sulfatase-like hydrolase/transferase [Prolixibacteraceae bacterium]